MKEKDFIEKWKSELNAWELKSFPNDFLNSDDCVEIELKKKSLIIGEEFFGKYEILDVEGNVFLQVDNYLQAKYLVYASRNKLQKVKLPKDFNSLKYTLSEYERYLDSILIKIQKDFKKIFKSNINIHKITNQIFHSFNLTRY